MLSMYEKRAKYMLCSTGQTQTGFEQRGKFMTEF